MTIHDLLLSKDCMAKCPREGFIVAEQRAWEMWSARFSCPACHRSVHGQAAAKSGVSLLDPWSLCDGSKDDGCSG